MIHLCSTEIETKENNFIAEYMLNKRLGHVFVNSSKATITQCDLSPLFFCIDSTLLCEFESDKI